MVTKSNFRKKPHLCKGSTLTGKKVLRQRNKLSYLTFKGSSIETMNEKVEDWILGSTFLKEEIFGVVTKVNAMNHKCFSLDFKSCLLQDNNFELCIPTTKVWFAIRDHSYYTSHSGAVGFDDVSQILFLNFKPLFKSFGKRKHLFDNKFRH
jgi:hypothetical protein